MGAIRMYSCGAPGPGEAHCTDYPGHDYSCYDAGEDVSFNSRQDFEHSCSDSSCSRPRFVNEGD